MKSRTGIIAIIVVAALLVGGGLYWNAHRGPRMVYTSRGYGGYVPSDQVEKKSNDPLQPIMEAYGKGNYKKAEAAAEDYIASKAGSKKLADRKNAARARNIYAFCAARQKRLDIARDRFTDLKEAAAKLPTRASWKSSPVW